MYIRNSYIVVSLFILIATSVYYFYENKDVLIKYLIKTF
nr:MAG TPA: Transcriptional regulator regulator, dna/rna-binding 3-helical bundle [Caudoviricetes sp.]DAU06592.1 MAG TPA: Transcriptional regulator regulator, dna/rna-binding 3-helical bundle [Caudoviricetes sp.]DAW54292.1 MAG TPA: Transcriptional regulator regulator, dna/rna-binding 3-helical bundle [Caudoviricetes sp.]